MLIEASTPHDRLLGLSDARGLDTHERDRVLCQLLQALQPRVPLALRAFAQASRLAAARGATRAKPPEPALAELCARLRRNTQRAGSTIDTTVRSRQIQ